MLAPNPLATATWPVAGDAPDLLAIVTDQAETIRDQEALLHAYQGNLNAVQQVTGVAAGTGTASGTQLTVSGVTGTIVPPQLVTGPSSGPGSLVPFGTTVVSQSSGAAGGPGVYTTSVATTASGTPLTFAPGASSSAAIVSASTSVTVTGTSGTIVPGAAVKDAGSLVPAGTTVLGQISGTAGKDGVYLLSHPVTFAAAVLLTFAAPPAAFDAGWPVPQDAPSLTLLTQTQTAILRNQNALIQHYQDLLNQSQTVPPVTGP